MKKNYETALRYGYDYEFPTEICLIPKMIEEMLQPCESWDEKSYGSDRFLAEDFAVSDSKTENQIKTIASAFALDRVVPRVLQRIPVIDIIGALGITM